MMATLTLNERQHIEELERMVDNLKTTIEAVSKFKEGDFLIAFHPINYSPKTNKVPVTNSYGVPKKFQVVVVDKNGIPYIKELNKNGKPNGPIINAIKFETTYGGYVRADTTLQFEVDPDYTDSIILDDQENYNATEAIKLKSDTFNAITKYNKSIKVNTEDEKVVMNLLTNLKVGDVVWRSNISSLTIIENSGIPRNAAGAFTRSAPFIKAINHKGLEVELRFWDFSNKSIYTSRPRTYKELKDPKL